MDDYIYELLQNTYECKIKKLGSHQDVFEVERRRKIGTKGKFIGLFPVYEYKIWYETLCDWTYRDIVFRRNRTGEIRNEVKIAICIDKVDNMCYWRYV